MEEPTFDIFRGTTDKDAVWLEAVPGLARARWRMEQIARAKPGQYFVFGCSGQSILARIDTRKSVLPSSKPKAKINWLVPHRRVSAALVRRDAKELGAASIVKYPHVNRRTTP